MDATRPTRVGFDPRVERIRSHTVAAFDAFRFRPDFNQSTPLCRCRMDATRPTRVGFDPRVERISLTYRCRFRRLPFRFSRLLRCAVVGWTPHVRRESGSIRVLSVFGHIRLPLSTPSVFRPDFNRLLHCAVVGRTPHVRRESGSIPVLSAFAHIRLPLSTPSVFHPDFNRLLHCAVVGWTPHVRRESGSIPVLSAFAHIRLPLSTPSVFRPDFIVYSTVPLSDGRHTSDESRVRSPC
ncbi:hypothetical protein KIN20_036626 [Parelaphostrongylus tenuis]|uniref:Uncharacterized protein n=1 Tax=Parelaphostrongylus tenuis TaxID=148309 RepID=A0AAD5RCT8_PARTN|nr:hypothetical protein KIN20_036626 [Parelaphostrongylus tenuis]